MMITIASSPVTKPAAFGVVLLVGGYFVLTHPCIEGKECPKAKGVSISLSATTGTSASVSTSDVFVPNLIIGGPANAKPIKGPDWTQS